jgi:hypothetical protein
MNAKKNDTNNNKTETDAKSESEKVIKQKKEIEKNIDLLDRKSTRLNSSHSDRSRMPSSA